MSRRKPRNQPAGLAPVANVNGGEGVLAPWPLIDRYPTILGSRISIAYISAVFRMCLAGYRQQYVDLLDELLVGEPHGYAVLQHRFNTTAGGRLEVTPASLPKGHPDTEEAKRIADDISAQIDSIPERQKALNRLLWGLYYGVSGAENIWDLGPDGWRVVGINYINSRRIAYPDQSSWRPRIWDQGTVSTVIPIGSQPTTELFGCRVDDFPGKFIIFEASIRGDYPTREGLGQQLAYWFGLKGMTARGAGEYIERFGKPWALATYSTVQPGMPPRAAPQEDIDKADAALAALGIGALAGATLPDTIKISLQGPGVSSGSNGINHEKWLAYIDSQIEEVVLTTSGITTPGEHGSRSSREVMKEGTRETFRYDARCLADTLKRDLARPLVALRHPGKEHLCPHIAIHVDELPDPLKIIEIASKGANAGLPIDADKVAERIGYDLVPNETGNKHRLMVPIKPVETSIDALMHGAPAPVETDDAAPARPPNETPPIGPKDDEET